MGNFSRLASVSNCAPGFCCRLNKWRCGIFAVFCSILLLGCSTARRNSEPVFFDIAAPQNAHLMFSGRGAAAGPMLMSALGASGIAVGLAIDVGIAKDIEKAGFGESFNVQTLVKEAAQQARSKTPTLRKFVSAKNTQVEIESLGFFEEPAKQDVIYPHLRIKIARQGKAISYKFPEDFSGAPQAKGFATLDALKSPGSPAKALLVEALFVVLSKAADDFENKSGLNF